MHVVLPLYADVEGSCAAGVVFGFRVVNMCATCAVVLRLTLSWCVPLSVTLFVPHLTNMHRRLFLTEMR